MTTRYPLPATASSALSERARQIGARRALVSRTWPERVLSTVGSTALHGGLLLGLGHLHSQEAPPPVHMVMQDFQPAAEVPEPEAQEPEPQPDTPNPPASPAAQATTQAISRSAATPTQPVPGAQDLPDLGLELSGASGSGLAVASGGGGAPRPSSVGAPASPTANKPSLVNQPAGCSEEAVKAKLVHLERPSYPAELRDSGVEGKVRVKVTVDEKGQVVSAELLQSLGHGLDEAALKAARGAVFEAQLRCGRPERATFNLSIRFSAS